MNLSTLCLLVALICFLVDLGRGARWPNLRMISLGLAFAVLSVLVNGTLRTP